MSHGGEIFGLGGDAASEPSFETALRGYEKKQVERYVARAENEIAALATLAPSGSSAELGQGRAHNAVMSVRTALISAPVSS